MVYPIMKETIKFKRAMFNSTKVSLCTSESGIVLNYIIQLLPSAYTDRKSGTVHLLSVFQSTKVMHEGHARV